MTALTLASRPQVARWAQSRRALWTAFAAVHVWLAFVGIVLIPSRAFYDLVLYQYWVATGLGGGPWPVLDGPWVYPVGALLPMLVPALAGLSSVAAYALGWSVLVTALDAVAVWALARRGSARGAWWWIAFGLLLGPVAMGRLDAIIAPMMILALLAAARRPRVAAVLITLGAWMKISPGVVILPLLMTARQPVRNVVAPAGLVCAAVVAVVAGGGGLRWLTSFLSTQGTRGLQVEAVAATPWTIAGLWRDDIAIRLNGRLITWEISGPGTATTARALDALLPLAILGIAVLLWRARSRPVDALLWGALALATVLIVVNKVGSPQYIGWLAPPIAVALAAHRTPPDGLPSRGLGAIGWIAAVVLVMAGLTQIIFPLAYLPLLHGEPAITVVLALRNLALVGVLGAVCVCLARKIPVVPDPSLAVRGR